MLAAVLRLCIRPLIEAFASCHHGHQCACNLISGKASLDRKCQQVSQAPGDQASIISSHSLADLALRVLFVQAARIEKVRFGRYKWIRSDLH
jgi:hypothetical protein